MKSETKTSLKRRRKVRRDGASLTSAGRLFHACEAATGNARSPSDDRRVDGTSSVDVAAERKCAPHPHLMHASLGPNGISLGSHVGAQLMTESPYLLQWDAPFPPKIVPSRVGSGPPSNTWLLGPTCVDPFLQGSLS